jgi:pimeloyl-ACP methyl ester carboxylesterase
MIRFGRPASAALATLSALTALAAGPAPRTVAAPEVVVHEVTFKVRNTNNTSVPCATDGAAHTIHGRIVGPPSQLDAGNRARTVVLSLHGLGYGEFFWDFQAVPGYDWSAALASRGIASVVIDRLGYGASSHPPGTQSCMGGQASIAHQVVTALRGGSYTMDGGPGLAFPRIGLMGHSAGGQVAQIEAYTFDDIDALVLLSWADLGASPQVLAGFARTGGVCLTGGNPPGYAPLGQNGDEFKALMFHDADPAVVGAATRLRHPDPCGDDASIPAGILLDALEVPSIDIPVLLVFGDNDAIFPPPALERQKGMYRGSRDLTGLTIPDTGHALSLERSAPFTRDVVSSWLCQRHFC